MCSAIRSITLAALFLCSFLQLAQPARAARSITLSAGSGYTAQRVPFTVTGDNLNAAQLRVWRIMSGGAQQRVPVYEGRSTRQRGAASVKFFVPILQSGLYLAEARSGTALHSIFVRLAARPRAPRSITLTAPNNVEPSRRVPFSVYGNNVNFMTAGLRVWRLESGAAPRQILAYQGSAKRKKDEDGEYEDTIDFKVPLQKAGVYLAEVRAAGLSSIAYLRVSDIGVVAKRAPRELLVYAVRLTTGAPMARAVVRLDDRVLRQYDYRTGKYIWIRKPGPSRSMVAGSDGVARFYNTPGNGEMGVIATALDGSRAQAEAPLAQDRENDLRVFFYTERPVYRPGQKVSFKGILRRDLSVGGQRGLGAVAGSLYAPVPNRAVQIEITDATNRKIDTLKVRTNGMGSFAGSTELENEVPVGRYSVEMKVLPIAAKGSPESFYGRFAVQEYRKPEYEVTATPLLDPTKPWATQGEDFEVRINARYYFGGAVKNARLVYTGAAKGETRLDDNGEAMIRVKNPQNLTYNDPQRGTDTTRSVHFQVIDESNRIVETDVSVIAPWSQIKPSISTNSEIYKLQDTAKIEVFTRDPLGRPVSTRARLRVYYYRPRKVQNPQTLRVVYHTDEIEFWNGTVQTDAYGRAMTSVRLGRAGYIKAVVSVQDVKGRAEKIEDTFWVTTPRQRTYYGYEFPTLNVLLDKPSYEPGQTVRALITTAAPGASALVTLQGDRIFMHRVIKLGSNATPFEFVFPAAASPGAHLTVGFVTNNSWASDSVYVKAPNPAQRLDIKVQPAKPQYRPGETARYTITTRDGKGVAQRAEVSLGFVDKAIYGIMADETPDPLDFFYGPRADRVSTNWFLPRELAGGSYQRIERSVPVRQRFEDTAYWNPFVITGANGMASLNFKLPDNLTTWRATARGITLDTKVGAAIQETLVTKPLLVRLVLPRFYVQHDRVRAQVIVQNNTKFRQNLRVSLRGDGFEVTPVGEETKGALIGTVEAGRSANFYWNVAAPEVPIGGKASLTATARGDMAGAGVSTASAFADSTDAMKLTLPIKPHGVRVRSWRAGVLPANDASAEITLVQPEQMIRNASRLEINFSPSLAGPMLAALPQLQGFPYGCTEQTLSRFVPAVVAARTLRRLGKPLPESMKELPKQVKKGLSILAAYQHSDGGWGWWKEDDTDPFITGYVLYGLGLAVEAGYPVDRNMILRGLRSVQQQFQQDQRVRGRVRQYGIDATGHDVALLIKPDTRAWMMLGYATAIASAKILPHEIYSSGDYLEAVFKVRDQLSNYGLAAFTVAYGRARHTTQKVVTLKGEAMLRYLLNTHQKPAAWRTQYYLDINGRLYYRDNKTHQANYVVPPRNGIEVPSEVAQPYGKYKDFNPTERDVTGLNASPASLATLVSTLEARAKNENTPAGPGTWWPSLVDDKGWRDSDIETTAIAVQALLMGKPNSPLILPALRWLMNQRRGDIWESTKDTAQVVIALADYLRRSPELQPDETVRVLVNGQLRKTVRFTPASIGQPDETILLDGLNENARITFERAGQGAVYFTARLTAYTSVGLDTPEDNGFKIERRYAVRNPDGHWREITGPIPNGELVRVELRVTTTTPREYVLLEDPIPAGFEAREIDDALAWKQEVRVDPTCDCRNIVLDPPSGWGRFPVTRRETRDDRVAFFSSYLWGSEKQPGQYLARYILRPEQTGTRTALPARIELMYHPDINGRSAQTQVGVE